MQCEECLSFIEEYIDGELDERSARQTLSHVESCVSCRRAYDALKREQEIYSNYSRNIDVSPAMWGAVYSRIKSERPLQSKSLTDRIFSRLAALTAGPRLSPAWAVLLVAIAVGLTVFIMREVNRPEKQAGQQLASGGVTNNSEPQKGAPQKNNVEQSPTEPGSTKPQVGQPEHLANAPKKRPRPSGSPTEPTPEQVVHEAQEKQLQAIAVLTRAVDKRRSELDPAVVAKFQVALTTVDRTIAETRQAVRQHPGDPVAAQYMLAAYAEKIEVLKEMAGQ